MALRELALGGKSRRLVCLLVVLLFVLFFYNTLTLSPNYALHKKPHLKYILFWNKYFHYPNFGYGHEEGRIAFLEAKCPINMCYFTENKRLMPIEEFDAVLFHMYYYVSPMRPLNFRSYPTVRKPNQVYIFYLKESPKYCGSNYSSLNGVFNWTITYRLDSDIVEPYGRLVPRGVPSAPVVSLPSDPGAVLRQNNTNPVYVVWLVSHCTTPSKREEYVAELAKYVEIDVYGDCGLRWPKDDIEGFYEAMNQQYKFYLSFENSLCKDYVTEKLFNILHYDVVPIVYGDANYSALVPPLSYIDVKDFKSPEALATYLMFLDQHPEEYSKYFWWKEFYTFDNVRHSTLCRLCEKLHTPQEPKSYANIDLWWAQNKCREPENLGIRSDQ